MLKKIEPYIHNKKQIIWDYNGTLIDDLDLCVSLSNELLRGQNKEHRVNKNIYKEVFTFPVINYYREVDIAHTEEDFKNISNDYMAMYKSRLHECGLFEGVRELLSDLKERGLSHAILTALHEQELKRQIQDYDLQHLFDHLFGLQDNYAHGKIERGQQLIEHTGWNPKETLLIGDTLHDLEVGQALNIEVLLIADGHQSYERLIRIHPHVLESRY